MTNNLATLALAATEAEKTREARLIAFLESAAEEHEEAFDSLWLIRRLQSDLDRARAEAEAARARVDDLEGESSILAAKVDAYQRRWKPDKWGTKYVTWEDEHGRFVCSDADLVSHLASLNATEYPGGMVGKVPAFNAENVEYVEKRASLTADTEKPDAR